ncbi:MAG: anti-sigma factor family protein [Bacillota bacterium]
MNCHECRYLSFDYVDDKLSQETRELFEKHLAECPACMERVARMQERKTEEEEPTGLFWYLLRPACGFKRFFIVGALLTVILVMALISIHLGKPIYQLFSTIQ